MTDVRWILLAALTSLSVVDRLNAKVVIGADDSLNFFVLADWGGLPFTPFTTMVERAIAREMGKLAAAHNITFVLALGDNFYFSGVEDVNDHRFKDTYEHVFSNPALGVNWYLIAGNHDYLGSVDAQIAYSNVDKRWNFPSYFYPLNFSLPSGSKKIDIIMLDTVMLCGVLTSDDLEQQPEEPENSMDAAKQLSWLEDQLKNSKADYLIVAGHYPVFSIGLHGPTYCLVRQLLPLLHKYNVSAYISGHDHSLQHFQYTLQNTTVEYFVTGAANFIEFLAIHKSAVPPGSLRFYWADITSLGGFSSVKITSKQLMYSFYAANGKLLYQFPINPRVF